MTHRMRCGVLLAGVLALFSPIFAWQQEVRYDIDVRLSTKQHLLLGRERLWYKNNSPDSLSYVWIHLYPNAYRDRNTAFARELERQHIYNFSFAPAGERGYIEIDKLRVGEGSTPSVETNQDRTELKVNLAEPLAPGDTTVLNFDFRVKIPAFFSRMGYKGKHYVISQWYPKMVVYDQGTGLGAQGTGEGEERQAVGGQRSAGVWHPDGYHATGEFYGEFGTYDVQVTVPSEMVVGATGELVEARVTGNTAWTPDSELAWMRLAPKARAGGKRDSMKTLHFLAENVHDFCWVADPSFSLLEDRVESTAVRVLVRSGNLSKWASVPQYARQSLEHFSAQYGGYPYRQLMVADGMVPAGGGMEYPQLIVVSMPGVPGLRLLELTVSHEIAHQWFYGMLGSNEMAEAWLDEGMATFAEVRYFETRYGKRGNLLDSQLAPFLPLDASDRYYQRMLYQLTATNNLLKPVLTPADEFFDEPLAYSGVIYSEGGFILDMLRKMVGDSVFDGIMKAYVSRFKFRHPTTDGFIRVAEEVSGRVLRPFFDRWLETRGFCDYGIVRVRHNRIEIEQKGSIRMPVEARARFLAGGAQTLVWDAQGSGGARGKGVLSFKPGSQITSVELDPEQKLLETDRWNNYYPRRSAIKPVFDLPSFDSYQVFYGPYAWYDGYHGFQLGPWLMGRRFVDAGPLHGQHQWLLSVLYRTNLRDFQGKLSYGTPLTFFSDRLRFGIQGDYSEVEDNAGADLSYHVGSVFHDPGADFKLAYRFTNLKNLMSLDTANEDFVRRRIAQIQYDAGYSHTIRGWQGRVGFRAALGSTELGSDSGYHRFSVEAHETWQLSRHVRLRMRAFGGLSGGALPKQEQFFLSGSLRSNGPEPVNWGYLGTFASQEHWHIEGDADLRGYIGEHRKGKVAAALNLSLGLPYLSPFFDIGNVADSWSALSHDGVLMDAGVRLSYGPFYADFPVWASRPGSGPNLHFRWMLGLTLSGISLGGL